MEFIITGIVLWSLVHLMPSIAPGIKSSLNNKFGVNGYKLLFTILIVSSIFLMVYGWRHSSTAFLYQLPSAIKHLNSILMLFSFICFGSAILPTRLLEFIRHPQLMFVISWSVAHLLVNGDSRSVLLFSSMAIWAILEIIFINKRDGEWIKPKAPGFMMELKSLVLSLVFDYECLVTC